MVTGLAGNTWQFDLCDVMVTGLAGNTWQFDLCDVI